MLFFDTFRFTRQLSITSQSSHCQRGTVQDIPAAQFEAVWKIQTDRTGGGQGPAHVQRHLYQQNQRRPLRKLCCLLDKSGRHIRVDGARTSTADHNCCNQEGGRGWDNQHVLLLRRRRRLHEQQLRVTVYNGGS